MFTFFEELLDAFAGEVKEAPGWLFVIAVCSFVPFRFLVPWHLEIASLLGLRQVPEHGTAAGLLALTLFLVGDAVDTIVFPREREKQRLIKVQRAAMLILGAWCAFFVLIRHFLPGGVLVVAFFVALKFPAKASSAEEETGFKWLHCGLGKCLRSRQADVKRKFRIRAGVYAISKELLEKAGRYNGWIRAFNEVAKFARTAIVPLALWTFYFVIRTDWRDAARTLAATVGTLLLYSALKTAHMCLLYTEACRVQSLGCDANNPLPGGIRVFILEKDTGYQLVGAGRGRARSPEEQHRERLHRSAGVHP